jgi:hypothetical protein
MEGPNYSWTFFNATSYFHTIRGLGSAFTPSLQLSFGHFVVLCAFSSSKDEKLKRRLNDMLA